MEQYLAELVDNEWPYTCIDHDRQVVRAIITDAEGWLYFVHLDRDDDFGKAALIETSGGGVEAGEALPQALMRELKEELGAEVEILQELGTVSDYYNLIHRHNITHYYLCRLISFGETNMTQDEINTFHLSPLRIRYEDAIAEYERCACTPIGRLIAARELPALRKAGAILAARND